MRTTTLSPASGKLHTALKKLRGHWHETEGAWKDAARRDFEEQHYSPLEAEALAAIRKIRTLDQILLKAQQECS